MSENANQHSGRANRKAAEDATIAEAAAKAAAEAEANKGNGQDTAKAVPTMTCELKSDKDTVIATFDVPRKWSAGMVNTEHSALIIDTSNLRQFQNNQTANTKARAKRFAEAKNDAERAENTPLTAADYQALWAAYEGPAIGDMQRMGSAERMRLEAGWSAWVTAVTAHNAAILAHNEALKIDSSAVYTPVITKAGKGGVKVGYGIPSAKTKNETDEVFKARKDTAVAERNSFIEKLLSTPDWAEKVQIQLDRLMAERGKDKKAEGVAMVETAGDSLL